MEKSNDGNKGCIEGELYNHTSLEESKAGADGSIRGILAKEGGGAVRDEGDDQSEGAHDDRIEPHRTEGEKHGVS